MCRLVETIRTEDGVLLNLDKHNQRLNNSIKDIFGAKNFFILEDEIEIPEFAKNGLFKCRVEYDSDIKLIEFIPYSVRLLKSLKLVEDNDIEYNYKFVDRQRIDELFLRKGVCDDILIVKNGLITDASYANVILKNISGSWITPSKPLLNGIRRTFLLEQGFISEADISVAEIKNYTEIKIINAMIDISETQGILIDNVF